MKNKATELNVDFIGGFGPLTREEENAVSAYIREHKKKIKAKELRHSTASKKRKSKPVA